MNQEIEKRQQQLKKIDTKISHKQEMRQKMWEIRQQPIQQTDFLRQAEGISRRNHRQEINRKSTDGGSENEEV